MRILKSLFILLCYTFLSQAMMAQLNSVHLTIDGSKVCFGVLVEDLGEVIIDAYGNVLHVIYSDDYCDSNVNYEYYSGFNSYEAGKLKSIGAITFTYYATFNDYEAGKIKTVAGVRVNYYSNFTSYEAGKLKSVADVKVNYYSAFNDYEAGKIKSIGSYKYSYFSGFGGSNRAGLPKSGYAKVHVNGINFMVDNWIIR